MLIFFIFCSLKIINLSFKKPKTKKKMLCVQNTKYIMISQIVIFIIQYQYTRAKKQFFFYHDIRKHGSEKARFLRHK